MLAEPVHRWYAGLLAMNVSRVTALVRRRTRTSLVLSAVGCLAAVFHPSDARADVTSWFSAGGGYTLQRNDLRKSTSDAAAMSFALGVGSSPRGAVVVGGLIRSTTYFSLGTDLHLAVRAATGGFARGEWGAALDVGPSLRLWSDRNYGRVPIHGMVYLGAPWGLQLGLGGDVFDLTGKPNALGATALLEIDLLRLTVMRRGATTKWWSNPSPAGGPDR